MASKNDLILLAKYKTMLMGQAKAGDMHAAAIVDGFNDRLMTGGLIKVPTTASTQVTGAGATTWRINVDAVVGVVDGVTKEIVASVDVVIHSATQYLVSGNSAIAAVVLKVAANGTATIETVKGASAVTGSQVAPTSAAIQAQMTGTLSWLKLGETTLNRTADTTVTQTYDNTKRDVGLVFV